MRTPAGKECKYFYGDYYRGRNQEECRLLEQNPGAERWSADLCKTCPVPDIIAANACPNLTLTGEIYKQFIVFGRKVRIEAYCTKSKQMVKEPQIGCGQCHPLPEIFFQDPPKT